MHEDTITITIRLPRRTLTPPTIAANQFSTMPHPAAHPPRSRQSPNPDPEPCPQRGRRVLSYDCACEIRRAVAVEGARQKDMAELYGVSPAMVSAICTGRAWTKPRRGGVR